MAVNSGANTVATLDGHFKQVYASKLRNLVPEGTPLYKMIEFISAEKQPGDFYHQPIILSHEAGFTYGGESGTAFALNDAIQSTSKDAQIRGSELILKSLLSVAAASRSSNSQASFVNETKGLIENMHRSAAKRMEIQLMYGRMGIGIVESVAALVVKIQDHEWASGIWSGAEGAAVSVYDTTLATLRVSTTVTAVNFETHEVTLAAVTGIVATDVFFFTSAIIAGPTYNEFAGIHKILVNTGVLFNVNAASYSLFKGNTINAGTNFTGGEATLTFSHIESAIAKMMEKGLTTEKVTVLCSPLSWKNLLVEQAAKRRHDASYDPKKFVDGARGISFWGPNGEVEIMSSIFCKAGYSYVLPMQEYSRIGSSDITFEQPGYEGKFFRLLEGFNGYELRLYSDQSLFTCRPGISALITFLKD